MMPVPIVLIRQDLTSSNPLALAESLRSQQIFPVPALVLISRLGSELPETELRQGGFVAQLTAPIRQSHLVSTISSALAGEPAATSQLTAGPAFSDSESTNMNDRPPLAQILVAEDNEVNQIVVAEMLARAGFGCQIAGTGREAVALVQSGDYDLMLMDCQMSEMDGFEATRAIREWEKTRPIERRLPIVALTANAIKGDRERCLAAGMDTYLTKPVNPAHLEECVRVLLGLTVTASPTTAMLSGHSSSNDGALANHCIETPFDMVALNDVFAGDVQLMCTAAEKFVETLQDTVQEISAGIAENDLHRAAKSAHTLKGTAGYMSAAGIVRLAAKIEMCNGDSLEAILRDLESLEIEAQRCMNYLPTLIEKLSAPTVSA